MADGDRRTDGGRTARGDAESDADDPVAEAGEAAARLRERYDELRRTTSRIDGYGRGRVEAAADAYRRAHRILDRYEEDAVGSGDFESYVRFRGEFGDAVDVDDDTPAGDAFEAADEAVDKRRLSESDFAAARDALEPAGEFVDLLEAYDDAVDDYRAARKAAREARKRLESRLDELREVADMADADLDADLSRLRNPIEAYDEGIREAFREFFKSASAREVFDFLDRADGTPFVDVDVPPTDLAEYVESHAAGEEPPATLLEYADYTNSKLEHYVDDPGALRTAVAVHRTYLERLDGEPLTLDWPPKPGDELAYEIDELVPLVGRIADDEVVATLRSVRELARTDEYERLRRAAEVRDALDEPELALIERGEADARVAEAERTLSVVDDVLSETERE
ncbi:tetratricopeptide (TPR) repeat protein [Halorubrum trapanicum]|uniref:Tetratricopeptide (TPR) repeat protein n=1 Tax=Halorubrum trapanicum TaxID=29284 RepID=A0A8J7RV77_9EURY|nr:hypothetical protein [Halorubrum trapanicum]MBP1902212.1 tetratricopeptide (TPR) repeat protein [Halorubrum trapanicum]